MSHVEFVHHDNERVVQPASAAGRARGARVVVGRDLSATRRPDGAVRVQQFGMPNVFYMNALPTDAEIGWQESLFWWVPIDDEQPRAVQPAPRSGNRRRRATRSARGAKRGAATIDSRIRTLCDADPARRADACATSTQRASIWSACRTISRRLARAASPTAERERLGRGDVGVIAIRKLWHRELTALERDAAAHRLDAYGRDIVPSRAWLLDGERVADESRATAGERAPILDVRPFVEIDVHLRALRRTSCG